jgi:hypothetical protein
MKNLDQYLEQARASEYFSGARLGHDLKRFLAEHGDACERLAHDISGKRIFLVGSGGSMANLSCAKYVFDHLTRTPVEVLAGYELIWRDPPMLDGDSVAFFASYSGETEDTVAALRFAVDRGARTVGLVKSADSTIGREADLVIPYGSAAIFEAPLAALVLVAAAAGGTLRLPRPLVWLGGISYSLYLWHFAILWAFGWNHLLLAVALSLAAAYASTRWIERPFRRRRRAVAPRPLAVPVPM